MKFATLPALAHNGTVRPRPHRPATTLIIATTGYGLTYWAWLLVGPLGPTLGGRYVLKWSQWALLGAAAVAVGSLARIPAGVLADRFGARRVLPPVSIGAAVSVLALAAVNSVPALIAVTCATGVAGGAFSAGAASVLRAFPPGRRGPALSVFGAGMGVAAAAGVASRSMFSIGQENDGLLLLGAALLCHAALAATLLRDEPSPVLDRASMWRMVSTVLRMPATRHMSSWFAVSVGGTVAFDLYLPFYLERAYGISLRNATIYAAVCVAVAAASRPLGGWLSESREPVHLLGPCFAAAAGFLFVVAFHPPLVTVVMPALLGLAVCLGIGAGTVLNLIGRTAPAEQAGIIFGVIGAVGSAAGLLPPLLLETVDGLNGSYAIGLTLLAGAALATAVHLHFRRSWMAAAAAFPAPASPDQGATIVVALSGSQIRAHLSNVVAALAALATSQELAIVLAQSAASSGGSLGHALVAGLRQHLPRHTILAIAAGAPPHPHEAAAIAEMLSAGAVPVALITAADPDPSAFLLAGQVDADQVLHVAPDRVKGLILHTTRPTASVPWPRPELDPSAPDHEVRRR